MDNNRNVFNFTILLPLMVAKGANLNHVMNDMYNFSGALPVHIINNKNNAFFIESEKYKPVGFPQVTGIIIPVIYNQIFKA